MVWGALPFLLGRSYSSEGGSPALALRSPQSDGGGVASCPIAEATHTQRCTHACTHSPPLKDATSSVPRSRTCADGQGWTSEGSWRPARGCRVAPLQGHVAKVKRGAAALRRKGAASLPEPPVAKSKVWNSVFVRTRLTKEANQSPRGINFQPKGRGMAFPAS